MTDNARSYTCPSAQPHSEDARVIGVVLGSVEEPEIAYTKKGVAVSEEMLKAVGPADPTRVFRFAGKCVNGGCAQFRNGACRLGADVLAGIPAVTDRLPACTIRATCRWFAENGPDVCRRCARVVTTVFDDAVLRPIAADREPRAEHA